VKEINRSGGLPILGTTFLGEVQAWNNRVLRLADEYLPLREAAKVDAIAGWTSVMVSADKVDALLQKNTAVVERIRRIIDASAGSSSAVASSRRAAARWSPDPPLG
jgi:hypothetical protein